MRRVQHQVLVIKSAIQLSLPLLKVLPLFRNTAQPLLNKRYFINELLDIGTTAWSAMILLLLSCSCHQLPQSFYSTDMPFMPSAPRTLLLQHRGELSYPFLFVCSFNFQFFFVKCGLFFSDCSAEVVLLTKERQNRY